MALLNNSSRLINVGGTRLVPGVPTDVPDEVMNNELVQEMMNEPVPNSDKMTLEAVSGTSAEQTQSQSSGAASNLDDTVTESEGSKNQPASQNTTSAATAKTQQANAPAGNRQQQPNQAAGSHSQSASAAQSQSAPSTTTKA